VKLVSLINDQTTNTRIIGVIFKSSRRLV